MEPISSPICYVVREFHYPFVVYPSIGIGQFFTGGIVEHRSGDGLDYFSVAGSIPNLVERNGPFNRYCTRGGIATVDGCCRNDCGSGPHCGYDTLVGNRCDPFITAAPEQVFLECSCRGIRHGKRHLFSPSHFQRFLVYVNSLQMYPFSVDRADSMGGRSPPPRDSGSPIFIAIVHGVTMTIGHANVRSPHDRIINILS